MKPYQAKIIYSAIITILFLGLNQSAYASNFNHKNSYYNHLYEINKEWKNHKDICPKGTISFRSDRDRIQLHLNLVITHLQSNIPLDLDADQRSNRLLLLQKLQDYADQKEFPINNHHLTRQPYFVDDYGTNCAVGQMIYVSGHQDLVNRISKTHNYDYIKDIETEGLIEWANKYGFKLEELKWIQPAYPTTRTINQVLDGTNGSVNNLLHNPNDGSLIISGDFTELDSLPCLNIGVYKNNQLSCLENGIQGKINDVVTYSGTIYAFGELHHNGDIFPIAKYDGSTWNYINIPNREGATCTAAHRGGLNYQLELSISHNTIPEHQEIWHYLNDNTWEKKAMINGFVLDIIPSSYGRVHTGHFDSVTVYNSNAVIDTNFTVKNVVIKKNYTNNWYGIGNQVSDTVKTAIEIGNSLIFGGACTSQAGNNNICISRYYNSVLQPLFINYSETEDKSVNTIVYKSGSTFTFGGDFKIHPVVGTYGNNVATYDLTLNHIEAIASLNRPVNSLVYHGNDLFVGGDFHINNDYRTLNYLGRFESTSGIKENEKNEVIKVYPNPFNSIIYIKNVQDNATYSITNIAGRVVKKGTVNNEKIEHLDFLPKGTYFLALETKNGTVVKKVIR